MRMTAELLRTAPAYINPLRDREINLRGFKFSMIENLGVTQDQYDTIDLSDNDLTTFENFPLLKTLRTIQISNNRINSIVTELGQYLPNVTSVILANNRLSQLEALEPLADITTITHLSLQGNPITRNENYRPYVIHLFPNLKVLDFSKVKPQERKESERLFGKSVERKANSAAKAAGSQASSSSSSATAPTAEQRQRIMEMIQNATSLEEINRLEKMLESGSLTEEATA